jgi:myosin tail region-interacting protein MTI1
MAVWGRIGVQVIESANDLLERSKKSIVGDGSFAGFVDAVLRGVPSARPALHGAPGVPTSYGHIIYTQSGPTVQRRITDIMPGDIIALFDTKFKGHKGLQSYHVHVGEHEPCVGIVSDYEPKKAKVRVFQASQQVAHQTVENVSYRLDDLKSGSIKVIYEHPVLT